ncbi:Ig-like domain-containing protein [Bradyrhizobium sp. AZCC 1721]|uniref:Ig-like domain-containing protein n=2 Tax=unclassified Bradyrhizobium TaxID=2631580 RepID=UPI002FF3682A
MATYDNIPLSWNDPLLSGVTSSSSVTLRDGGTLSYKSITDTGSTASVVGLGSFSLDHMRISSREGVRIGGDGDVTISNSYLESTGQGSDHADTIQIYAPGSTGNVTITNTTIVAHTTAATAGMFVADDWSGTLTFDNVVFQGGPFGLRIAADANDISVALKDVYFVGPFGYDDILFQEVNADINITQWENVRSATIVNGELVPGELIPPPFPVEGGGGGAGLTTIDHFSNDSGTSGDGITNDSTLTLSGSAAANSTVKVFDGTTQIGTTTTNSSGAWSYTTAALSNGNHSLKATATTTSGTSSTSSVLAVKIDTVAPTAPTMATPTNNANGGLNLTGTAEANSVVKVFDGTAQIGTATANSSGVWNYTTGALAAGSHSLTARATDAAGNTGAASAVVTASTGTSAPPATPATPTIASFSNDTGAAGDGITSDNTLQLKGTAAANSTVKIYDGSTQIGTTTASSTGSWDYITSVLTNAKHVLTATATTSSGQTSAASGAVTVTVDTLAPTAPALSSNAIVNTNQVKLSGTAEANSTVTVYDGTTVVGTGTTNSTGAWSVTTNALSTGTHALTVKAADAAGNVSAASQSVSSVIGGTSPTPTPGELVESAGVTSLVESGGKYYLNSSSGSGPTLKYGGADFVDGQDGTWTPIGAEKTATGYQVAWKEASTGQYTAWNTDNNGNYVSHVSALTGSVSGGSVSGTNYGLKLLETSFHQDLNGDGQVGASSAPAPTSSVELTTMYKNWSDIVTIKGVADANSQIKLYDGNASLGTVNTAADGTWSFKTSSAVSDTVHTYTAKQIDSTGQVVGTSGNAILGSTGSNTLTSSSGDDVFVGNGGADTFVFAPNFGNDVVKDFGTYGRSHDVVQFSKSVFDSFASVLAHATQVGQDVVISADADNSVTLKNTKLGAINSHDFHFS